jgi:DNA-damage-inducible protein D
VECTQASHAGGKIAGDARIQLEHQSGQKVISTHNYLVEPEKKKKLRK